MDKTVQLLPTPPLSCICVGASLSGKTTFVVKLLTESYWCSESIRKVILVCKFRDQPVYNRLKNKFGDLLEIVTHFDEQLLENLGDPKKGQCVMILDDCTHEICNNPLLCQIFIGTMHHMNVSIFLIAHNFYASRHPNWITCTRNATILAIFQSPRNQELLTRLNSQLYPGGKNFVTQAYHLAKQDHKRFNNNEHGYILIDYSMQCHDSHRLRSGIGSDYYKFLYLTPNIMSSSRAQVERYYLVAPEEYERLMEKDKAENEKLPPPPPPALYSTHMDLLELLPEKMRKNTYLIMKYLSTLPDQDFTIVPGTLEVVICTKVIPNSNFIDLLKSLHTNLPTQYNPIGLRNLLWLLARKTGLPSSLLQSARVRHYFDSVRLSHV